MVTRAKEDASKFNEDPLGTKLEGGDLLITNLS